MENQQKNESVATVDENNLSEHTDNPPISWTAAEYIIAEKNAIWYVFFAIILFINLMFHSMNQILLMNKKRQD
jgi:hypothetical protein